ncbi:hypothetical protein CISG_03032 [Coccidioides immitis RMSCC 3703]|uniref:Uncharacterized protein n=2 Tax=Coccidioides immitis TaxID=5501 RepID=A0A0J8QJ23_COCIT|nr:hypothetical protein CIRG_08038 [Coccidioides immitis RMSCC 2394]KMU72384.1 hypothetical protein CISG_03032 [Coccidioides immitis RMSCC 3703]
MPQDPLSKRRDPVVHKPRPPSHPLPPPFALAFLSCQKTDQSNLSIFLQAHRDQQRSAMWRPPGPPTTTTITITDQSPLCPACVR